MYDNSLARMPDPVVNPNAPGFSTANIQDIVPAMSHELNGGQVVSVKFEGNYWSIQIGFPETTIEQASTIVPFLYSMRSSFSDFYVQLPQYAHPRSGAWSTNPIVAGNITIGGSSNQIIVTNWPNTHTIEVGDMIKLSNSHKIYMVTGYSRSGTTVTLDLNCSVVNRSTLNSATLDPNDIKFKVRFKSDFSPPQLTADGIYTAFTIDLRENIL
jgi:hypothetical protein